MKTSGQNKCIKWICNVLEIEYPYSYRDNFYDAQDFISQYYEIAKSKSTAIDAYRGEERREAERLLALISILPC